MVPGNKLVDHEVTQLGRFVVLLRGVNVGKGNKVPMAGFRAALEDLGCTSVQTLLNSGNAVFSSASRRPVKLATDIASSVEARFGVVTPVVVKSAAEFATIVNHNPIAPPESEHSRFLVAFAMDQARLQELASMEPLESKAGEAILGKRGRSITTRNWGTTLKLATLLGGGAS